MPYVSPHSFLFIIFGDLFNFIVSHTLSSIIVFSYIPSLFLVGHTRPSKVSPFFDILSQDFILDISNPM